MSLRQSLANSLFMGNLASLRLPRPVAPHLSSGNKRVESILRDAEKIRSYIKKRGKQLKVSENLVHYIALLFSVFKRFLFWVFLRTLWMCFASPRCSITGTNWVLSAVSTSTLAGLTLSTEGVMDGIIEVSWDWPSPFAWTIGVEGSDIANKFREIIWKVL